MIVKLKEETIVTLPSNPYAGMVVEIRDIRGNTAACPIRVVTASAVVDIKDKRGEYIATIKRKNAEASWSKIP